MIGLILVVLAALVLFEKIPGNQVAWLIVLVCGLLIIAGAAFELPGWITARRKPQA